MGCSRCSRAEGEDLYATEPPNRCQVKLGLDINIDMEAWQSGRMCRTRNAVGSQGPRRFESSRFRQSTEVHMDLKTVIKNIPKLPLSALVFYVGALTLWQLGYIPSPGEIIVFLKGLYLSYGYGGLFIASFLEGIIYLGLYFPGSFVVALAVILSDGGLMQLLLISLVVATALTISSAINYILGSRILSGKPLGEPLAKKSLVLSRGLLFSALHPDVLAFYFFNLGLKKQGLYKIFLVPVIMVPYGFVLGYIIYAARGTLRTAIESPYVVISAILFWITIAFILESRKNSARTHSRP